MSTPVQLDLVVDLNTVDDTGLPWAFLDDAINPSRLVPGAHVIVGSGEVRAVAQVIDVDNDLGTCDRSEAPWRRTPTY